MTQTKKTIVVTGGGTGGHLSVARSFIDELHTRGHTVIYIGSTKGADKKWFENYESIDHSFFLETKGVVNQNFFGKIISLLAIFKYAFFCKKLYKEYGVTSVISVGGFSAASGSFGAIISSIPLFIHEQNSVMGNLNKVTAKYAKIVFSSYNRESPIKDYPIDRKFFLHQRVRKNIKTIIFLGGSQGATAINTFAMNLAPLLKEKGIHIIHQTGKNDLEKCRTFYLENHIEATIFDFETDIIRYMKEADFAISRSGASSLWELCALGIPTLFIPYPHASLNHQYFNAKFLYDGGLCLLKNQNEIKESMTHDILKEILSTPIEKISKTLISIIKKDGVKQIVDKILEIK